MDHPPGGRDDVANAVAGACVLAVQASEGYVTAVNLSPEPLRHALGGELDYAQEAALLARRWDEELLGWRR